MQKMTTCLWFDGNAEEAVNFYASVFADSKIGTIARYGEEGAKASGQPKGSAMTVPFELNGQAFLALNGGPMFRFSPAISFMVNCENQDEVDGFWRKLSAGGEEQRCGWLKDKYGISWQIVPSALGKLMSDPDPAKSGRVMKAMLQMNKIDIAGLQRAYEQR